MFLLPRRLSHLASQTNIRKKLTVRMRNLSIMIIEQRNREDRKDLKVPTIQTLRPLALINGQKPKRVKEDKAMLVPSIFGENLFDDWFDFPDFRDLDKTERKLYGRHADRVMKTDVHEHDDHYELDIDLPGFKKEEITIELNNGYLVVSAAKGLDEEDKTKKGKLIRQERYTGSMQRSFYVGDNVKEEDVKAKFEHGVLKLSIPKQEQEKLPEKKTILIEG